jgi:glutathione S-transferase
MAELEIIGPARHPGVIVCRMACFEKGTLHLHCVPRQSQRADRIIPLAGYPLMRHGKVKLFGVRAIISYIDSRFNGRDLMPANDIRAAEVEQWTTAILTGLNALASPDTAAEACKSKETANRLAGLNDVIGHRMWLVGRGFTLADMVLMPAVSNLCEQIGHETVLQRYPSIGIWFEKHTARRSWKSLNAQHKPANDD